MPALPSPSVLRDAAVDLDYEVDRLRSRLARPQALVENVDLATLADDAWEIAVRQARLARFGAARQTFATAGVLMVAHVGLHCGPEAARVEVWVPGARQPVGAVAGPRTVRAEQWLHAFHLCAAGGQWDAVDRLASMVVPPRPTLTPHHVVMAEATAEFWLAGPDGDHSRARAALARAHEVIAPRRDSSPASLLVDHVDVPVIALMSRVVRREPVDQAVRDVIAGHEAYWMRADPVSAGCWLSLPALAWASVSEHHGVPVDVDHTYLPLGVLHPAGWGDEPQAPRRAAPRRMAP